MDLSAFGKLFKTCVPHILEKIFFSLDYESFKACHEVCEAWNEILLSESIKEKAKKMLTENGEKLRDATRKGNANEVRGILSIGMVDVNCELDNYHVTILQLAVINGPNMVVNQLLNAGADINKANSFGSTPLHMAAGGSSKEVVKHLIERGAQVDKVEGSSGLTPLHRAAMDNSKGVVQILLDSGADPSKPDNMGHTPEFHARRLGRRNIVKMLTKARHQRDLTWGTSYMYLDLICI